MLHSFPTSLIYQAIFQRRHTDGQQVHEKMFNTTNHQGNSNQNYSEIPHGMQHTRFPCPSLSPIVCSNSCPLSSWCHATISPSVALFSCLQSVPASGCFLMSQFFASGGHRIGISGSASVFPMNIQD